MNVAYKFVADKLTNIATPKGTEPSKCQANFMLSRERSQEKVWKIL